MSEVEIQPGNGGSGGAVEGVIVQPGMLRVADELQAHVAALKSADVLAGMIHQTVQAYDGGTDRNGKQRAGRKEAAIAIYHGQQLGLNPLASLQNIFIVHGTPGMFARTMRALLLQAGHEVETIESNERTATVRGRRAGTETWESSTWTIERARKAKYTSNSKYDTEPENMLYAKACAEVCRRVAPDVLLGMAYSAEELEEQHTVQATSEIVQPERKAVSSTAGKVRGAIKSKRKAEPKPEPEPAVIDETDTPAPASDSSTKPDTVQVAEPTEPEPAVIDESNPADLATEKQQRAMLALLADVEKMTDTDEILAWAGNQVHRKLGAVAELTTDEAGELITALQAWKAQDEQTGGKA